MKITLKLLAAVAAIGLCSTIAKADKPKGYNVKIGAASQVVGAELPAGEYKLLVDQHSPKVIFRDVEGEEIEIEAKVEVGEEKFPHTALIIDTSAGAKRIRSIQLGGTRTKISFD